jgi:drug/metabolite transporter (DMT)-like permease
MVGFALLSPFLVWRTGSRRRLTHDLKLHCWHGLFHNSGYAWQTPTGPQLLLFLSAGLFGTLGYFFITWSYRLLDISAMQPVTSLAIAWAP